jgi:SAM-dependent methyltransferase
MISKLLWQFVLLLSIMESALCHFLKDISTTQCAPGNPRPVQSFTPPLDGQFSVPRRSFLDTALVLAGLTVGSSEAFGMTTDVKTGIALPDQGEIESSIPHDWTDVEDPFLGSNPKSLFGRLDSAADSIFYTDPRFVEHVDDNAVRLMTEYISNEAARNGDSVLDLCSSWTSHIDSSRSKQLTRLAGLGMNSKELESNPSLTDRVVQDLNINPALPYKDASFDVVLCQLSIDYLTKPLDVLREVGRVLKPGGSVHILFSNRLFLSKAVGLWTGADDIDHAFFVGNYLHLCNGNFEKITARDLSTRKGREKRIAGDPLYVVTAKRA